MSTPSLPDEHYRLYRRNGWALTWLAIAFGATIIGTHVESGRHRWASRTWQIALQVPGSPATWGAVILAGGVLLCYGLVRNNGRAVRAGMMTGFLWFCALTATALAAFLDDLLDDVPDTVNPLAAISWLYLAWMYGSRLRLVRLDA